MAEHNIVAIVDDFKDTVDDEVEGLIDKIAQLMRETIIASSKVEVPSYMQDNGRYDALKVSTPAVSSQFDYSRQVKHSDGSIDIDATLRQAATDLYYPTLEPN